MTQPGGSVSDERGFSVALTLADCDHLLAAIECVLNQDDGGKAALGVGLQPHALEASARKIESVADLHRRGCPCHDEPVVGHSENLSIKPDGFFARILRQQAGGGVSEPVCGQCGCAAGANPLCEECSEFEDWHTPAELDAAGAHAKADRQNLDGH